MTGSIAAIGAGLAVLGVGLELVKLVVAQWKVLQDNQSNQEKSKLQ